MDQGGIGIDHRYQLIPLLLNGYYDLSTPFFATEYDIAHLHLPRALREDIVRLYDGR